jgi:hypothetical protein
MTIKLVLLKSGEDIIADVQEMVVGNDDSNKRVVGYFLDKPCIIKLRDSSKIHSSEEEARRERQAAFEVSLYPWMPLSKDTKIPVSAEWVVTMVEPIDNLKEMYTTDVINYGKNSKSDSLDERADFTESD